MHEFGVMMYLLEGVEKKARELGADHILSINLIIGDRASIVDDSLLYYFDELTPGTLAEGARLNIQRVPMRFHCGYCDDDYGPTGIDFRCPECSELGELVNDGSQFLVESIEIEGGEVP